MGVRIINHKYNTLMDIINHVQNYNRCTDGTNALFCSNILNSACDSEIIIYRIGYNSRMIQIRLIIK